MIVAVVDFKDWGLQIIALLCHRIGKDYNTSCHRIGKEKRCLKFLKKRIGSHDLAKRWGVLSWFNMFRYVSEKILSKRVMSRGCFTLLNTPRPVKKCLSLYLVPSKRKYFPHFGHKLLDSIHHKLLGSKEKKEVVSLLIVDMSSLMSNNTFNLKVSRLLLSSGKERRCRRCCRPWGRRPRHRATKISLSNFGLMVGK